MANSARIDELRKKFDENPRRYFAPLANEYRKAGDLDQAIFICQEYLPQQPGHMSGHIVHGQALYDLGRTDEAKVAFETALSLDPENLIALRHLGDIARHVGDTDSARMWYQRVLEADPRNEEIAQIMISLLSTPEPGSVNPAAPTPIASAQAVPAPESWRSAVPSEDPAESASAALELEKSEEATVPELAAEAVSVTPVSTPVAPPTGEDFRRRVSEDDLLDFDDASIGGLSLSEVAPNVQVEPAEPAHDEPSASLEGVSESSSISFDELSVTEAAVADTADVDELFEADPFAIATPAAFVDVADHRASADLSQLPTLDEAPEPDVAHAADITLGLPDDGLPLTESPEETTVANATLEGLETFEPGIIGASESADAIGTESYFAEDEEDAAPAAEDVGGEVPAAESTEDEFGSFEPAAASIGAPPPLHTPVWSSVAVESIETTFEPNTPAEPMATVESSFDEEPVESISVRETTGEDADEAAEEAPAPVEDAFAPIKEASATEETSAPIGGGHDGQEVPESFPEFAEAAESAEPAQPFVTETMAELYLQQGHLESALDIYRRLVEQRPDDEGLSSRLRAVEDEVHGTSAAATAEAPDAAAPSGPTIREFLISVFSRSRPAAPDTAALTSESAAYEAPPRSLAEEATFDNPEMAEEAGLGHPETFEAIAEPETPAPVGFDAMEEIATDFGEPVESAAAEEDAVGVEPINPAPASAVGMPTPSTAGATVRGSIDALFSGANASTADMSAATTLAEAFAPEVETPTQPLHGLPAHRATDELSLDHVFKGNTPPRPSTEVDGFSFDQFFAANADESPAASNAPSTAEPEAGDDIAQFNAWLNGLKKS